MKDDNRLSRSEEPSDLPGYVRILEHREAGVVRTVERVTDRSRIDHRFRAERGVDPCKH